MRIYTGYFAKTKQYETAGLTPVSICLYPPKFYRGLTYSKFYPTQNILRSYKNGWIDEEEYIKRFNEEVLDALNKEEIKNDILSLNKDIVLLCFEKSQDFCHRHIVAKWLNEELNMPCSEFLI